MSTGPRQQSGPAFVPLARPSMGEAELSAIAEVIESGWLTTGPRVKAFEAAFARHVGAAEAVALNSCTAGLHLSLLACKVGAGDEVLTTPLTFCATANTVLHAGATPVFVDVNRSTGTMDAAAAREAVTSRTRVLMPVHYAGRPADPLAFRQVADAHGLRVIEDAAHCVDARVDGRRVGSIADFTAFSFYSTKNLATGEGGMVTTASSEDADWMRVAALHGLSRDAWARYAPGAPAQYDVVMPGFKYNMMDLQAALGLAQLARLGEMQAHRACLWQRYDEGLRQLPLGLPATVWLDPRRTPGRAGAGGHRHERALPGAPPPFVLRGAVLAGARHVPQCRVPQRSLALSAVLERDAPCRRRPRRRDDRAPAHQGTLT
jgi:dTDP-4-amino-4,6-dideoxygalactose transaminase